MLLKMYLINCALRCSLRPPTAQADPDIRRAFGRAMYAGATNNKDYNYCHCNRGHHQLFTSREGEHSRH